MSDLIDRQSVIDLLKQMRKDGYMVPWEGKNVFARIRMLPALQLEECTEKRMETHACDLISRRAALDAVEKNACNTQRIMDAVNNLPPAQPEPQWIPVERGFPEDYTDVLVWFEYFRYGDYNCLYQTHGIGTYVANYNSWTVNHESGWKDLRVIAWMPLPEAYKPNNK